MWSLVELCGVAIHLCSSVARVFLVTAVAPAVRVAAVAFGAVRAIVICAAAAAAAGLVRLRESHGHVRRRGLVRRRRQYACRYDHQLCAMFLRVAFASTSAAGMQYLLCLSSQASCQPSSALLRPGVAVTVCLPVAVGTTGSGGAGRVSAGGLVALTSSLTSGCRASHALLSARTCLQQAAST